MGKTYAERWAEGVMGEVEFIQTYDRDLKLTKSKDKYSHYDFDYRGLYVELKSRPQVSLKQYPSTIIGQVKLDWFKDRMMSNYSTFRLVFKFVDGYYYIDYEPSVFEGFEVRPIRGANYVHIPVNKLKPLINIFEGWEDGGAAPVPTSITIDRTTTVELAPPPPGFRSHPCSC